MPSATTFGPAAFRAPQARRAAPPSPTRRTLLLRIVDAVADSNRRKAEREILRFTERNGGKLTDSVERGIERSFL